MPQPSSTHFRLAWITPLLFGILAGALQAWIRPAGTFEVNEGIELLKVGVLKHDARWFRTMWDDQPGTLMWILSWIFHWTGPCVVAGRFLVIALNAGLLGLLARTLETRLSRGSSLALVPLLLTDSTVFQLMGSVMLEPSSIPFALGGAVLFWNRLDRPDSSVSAFSGALTGLGLAIKLTAVLPAQLAGWAYLWALWEARLHPETAARRRRLHLQGAIHAGTAILVCSCAYWLGDYDLRILNQSHVVGVLGAQPLGQSLPAAFWTSIGAWMSALPALALLPTSVIVCWTHPAHRAWTLPWLATLLSTTVVLSIYPFWHNYYVIHFTLPLVAMATPTLALLIRGLLARLPSFPFAHPTLVAITIAGFAWMLSDSLALFRREPSADRTAALRETRDLLSEYREVLGTVFASTPHLYLFESDVLPVPGLEVVVEKRRQCGNLTPKSALETLRRAPPGAIIADPSRSVTSIYNPFSREFLDSGYSLILENGVGEVWIRKDIVQRLGIPRRPNRTARLIEELKL